MSFTEDLTPFFDTDDFADTATLTIGGGAGVSINVIFNKEWDQERLGDAPFSGVSAVATCQSSDLDGVNSGDTLAISATTYTITDTRDLGATSLLVLRT
ncbi:MAG TPA: hypothetical protein HPP79_11020 [Gammaproteobacteria bacterium]|jgi:hypothetical protein|nr:hypothetical protein [Gammaproteobacteria bacterium]